MDFGGFSIKIRIFGTANGQRQSETINKVTKSFPECSRINIESITNVAGDISVILPKLEFVGLLIGDPSVIQERVV